MQVENHEKFFRMQYSDQGLFLLQKWKFSFPPLHIFPMKKCDMSASVMRIYGTWKTRKKRLSITIILFSEKRLVQNLSSQRVGHTHVLRWMVEYQKQMGFSESMQRFRRSEIFQFCKLLFLNNSLSMDPHITGELIADLLCEQAD